VALVHLEGQRTLILVPSSPGRVGSEALVSHLTLTNPGASLITKLLAADPKEADYISF